MRKWTGQDGRQTLAEETTQAGVAGEGQGPRRARQGGSQAFARALGLGPRPEPVGGQLGGCSVAGGPA